MTVARADILRELELLPVWRLGEPVIGAGEAACATDGGVEYVAQAASPAPEKLIQGGHDSGYLPHLKAEGGIYFATFRLADSLPAELLDQLDNTPEQERNRTIEKWLDQGHGECLLANSELASIVSEAIRSGDGKEYRLHAWTVMPNHVHLVLEPLPEQSLSDSLQRIKSWTAHEINSRTGRSGTLWQRESYDHLVRDDDELARWCDYVRQNPVRAGLVAIMAEYAFGDQYQEPTATDEVVMDAVANVEPGNHEIVVDLAVTQELISAGEAACATDNGVVDVAQAASPAATPSNESETPVTTASPDRRTTIMQMDWPELKQAVAACEACFLASTRTQTVFGVGDEHADWLFVGEAPGAEEDKRGEPFVGAAGQLLDNMLAAVQLKRGQNVYIANVLKCRPPQNRDPQGEEVVKCDPFLKRQVELIKPKLIVALGRFAAQSVLATEQSIGALRGKLHDYHGVPVIVTYHPAYLLRNLPDKAKAWEDLCFARATMRNLQSVDSTSS